MLYSNYRIYLGKNMPKIKGSRQEKRQRKINGKRFEFAISETGIGIWDFYIKKNLFVWNENMFKLFNANPETFEHQYSDFDEYIHPDDKKKVRGRIDETLSTGKAFFIVFRIISHPDGVRYIKSQGRVTYNRKGTPLYLTGISQDITKQKKMEEDLKTSKERFELSVTSTGIGVWDLFLEENKLLWNDNMFKLFNVDPKSFKHSYEDFERCVHPDDRSKIKLDIGKALSTGELLTTKFRLISHPDGIHYIYAQAKVSDDESGRPVRLTGINQDITKQTKAEMKLEKLAKIDMLTQLPNRIAIYQTLEKAMAQSNEHHELALFYIDIDKFKETNDTLGHEAGDELLRKVADAPKKSARENDHVGRIAGDEFILIAEENTSRNALEHLASETLKNISNAIKIKGHDIHPLASIGIAFHPSSAKNKEELLEHADLAMYQAKEKGGDQYSFFNAKLLKK